MDIDLTGLGATGVFVIYLLKTILPIIIPAMKGEKTVDGLPIKASLDTITTRLIEAAIQVGQIHKAVYDLHEWCSVVDQDGVKLIYVRRSIVEALEQTADSISKIILILDRLREDVVSLKEHKKS